ncbi:MAG: DNA polymerase IV [Pseudonocardia sp.]|nr:DNA polymerase IV [Pseudonocardia sp.]
MGATGPGSGVMHVLHVDLDQFVAAVEIRRTPRLRGRPVAVGGSGDPRMHREVVSTASYEARAFGVRSGMPLRVAVRRCPELVVVPVDAAAYDAASGEVMAVLREFGAVEVLGWDEAFLAPAGPALETARAVRVAVLDRTGLSCSVGVGDTRQRAKLATGFAKPAGVFLLDAANWSELMAHRPTTALWGIGPRMAARLAAVGLKTVAELGAADEQLMIDRFGPTMGPRLRELGLGGAPGDVGVVTEAREPVSRGHQRTYPVDLRELADIRAALVELAETVTTEIAGEGRSAVRVFVTVRTSSFFTRTLATKLPEPTTEATVVAAAALRVLERFDLRRPVRLLGVRVEFPRLR